MKKVIALILVLILALGCLAGCGGQSSSTASNSSSSSAAVKKIRISHGQPETHPEHLACLEFERIIEEKLGDKYDVEVHPNAVMGGTQQALSLMQSGSLEMVVGATSDLEAFNSDYKIFGLPYIFASPEHFMAVLDNEEFMDGIYNSTADSGLVGVSAFYAGTRSFYAKFAINSPADLQGKKIRVMSSETNVKMAEALGGAGVVMSFGEVYTGLQQGVIDVAESPQMVLVSHKHGEVAKYYANDEHQIIPDMMVASKAFMDSIDPADKEVFAQAFKDIQQYERELWMEQEAEIIKQCEDMGVTFLHVDKTPFMDILVPFTANICAESETLQAKYDAIQALNPAA